MGSRLGIRVQSRNTASAQRIERRGWDSIRAEEVGLRQASERSGERRTFTVALRVFRKSRARLTTPQGIVPPSERHLKTTP